MGIYSTVDLTREEALKLIRENIEQATDEELADALFGLLGQRSVENYRIVDRNFDDESIV